MLVSSWYVLVLSSLLMLLLFVGFIFAHQMQLTTEGISVHHFFCKLDELVNFL